MCTCVVCGKFLEEDKLCISASHHDLRTPDGRSLTYLTKYWNFFKSGLRQVKKYESEWGTETNLRKMD